MALVSAGVFPPIVTPFANEKLDTDAMRSNIGRWNSSSLSGYVVGGSNGEGPYLSDDELAACIEVAAASAGPNRAIIAGTGRETTRATVSRTGTAATAGADAALIVAPSYFRKQMNDAALIHHYRTVADASPIPILLYHVPKFAPVTFSLRMILELASHPNIVGIKETSGDFTLFSQILRERPAEFLVYVGSANHFLAGMSLGADGGILALANVAPNLCCRLMELVEKGRLREARELQMRVLPVNQAITVEHGIPGLKYALSVLGYQSGEVLSPLQPVSADSQAEIRQRLSDAGLEGDEVF